MIFRQSWEEFLSIFEWIGNRLLKLLVGWIKLLEDLGNIYEWSISVDFRRKCRQKLFSSSSWCPRLPLAAPLPPATTRLVDQSQIADNKTLTNWNWGIEHKGHRFWGYHSFYKTRSCAALRAADLGLSGQDAFWARTFGRFPGSLFSPLALMMKKVWRYPHGAPTDLLMFRLGGHT